MAIPVQIRNAFNLIVKSGTRFGAPLLLFFGLSVYAERPDSVKLEELTVHDFGPATRTLRGGNLKVNVDRLRRGNRVLGEVDIVNALKRSGGISSVGDYGSGIIIQGNEPGQTVFRIDGAPVYFPYRFGGVFSTFNSTHFTSATILQSARTADSPSRLGAVVDLAPGVDYDNRFGGAVNVGLLASTLTLRSGIARKFALTASGRVSYIDRLYGRFMKGEKNAIAYQFYDVNVAAGWRIDSINTISVNYFRNGDSLSDDDSHYSMAMRMYWRNNVASVGWHGAKSDVCAYFSDFSGNMDILIPQASVLSHSRIFNYGVTGRTNVYNTTKYSVNVGGDVNAFHVEPLSGHLQGALSREPYRSLTQKCWELRSFANLRVLLSRKLTLNAGLSLSTFSGDFFAVDPRFSLDWLAGGSIWTFGAGVFSQYLHLVGFSELGLASNFWFASRGSVRPQRSLDLSAAWQKSFFGGRLLVSALVYGKRVVSQSEYQGQVLDLISVAFNPDLNISTANGYNCGTSVSAQKRFGALTATVSYSFGYAIRRRNDQWVRSLTDTGHQLKIDADYEINDHWNVGAAFTFASGRVYTPTRYLYLIAGQIMTEYGKYNSARMPAYQRLDVFASYRTGRHSLNFSLINAYGHRNVEMQYFVLDIDRGEYKLFRKTSLYRFLPSLSYTVDF